ncbi:hypothetical protein PUMCH_000092 [Australozyma saopauloensis]|uniref:GLC7-interacting protein 3 n=1 Tax=Australozyma saopauloensis TaxID=291208 RepID=A0AAX4H4F9_9ASCO|nr:hypothetical protein PUMCH_000092 [[Candida] saopauloensis]
MSLPTSDIETGVSNGDVDWLFRGKSKKLTKKLASEYRPSVSLEEKPTLDTATKPSKGLDSASSQEQKPTTDQVPSEPSATVGKEGSPPSNNQENHDKEEKARESVSNHDQSRMGRSASVGDEPPQPGTRSRSSSAPIAPTDLPSGSSLGRGLSLNLGSLDRSKSVEHEIASDTTQAASPKTAPKKSKHLFSFLSSKFKSSAPPNGSSHSQPKSSSPPSVSSAAFRHSKPSQAVSNDLSHSTHRPPSEMGVQTASKPSRKNSVSSGRLSEERESSFFFRRKSVISETVPPEVLDHKLNRNPNKEKSRLVEVPDLTLKRVTFAVDQLEKDPQQQIPSRKPRRGNVLIPEDLVAPTPRLNQGISATDSARTAAEPKYSEADLLRAKEAQKRALMEAEVHATEAHLSAKKLALQVAQHKHLKIASVMEEDDLAPARELIEIDKPLHVHESHFAPENPQETVSAEEELSLETLYTRCCHLREILPIPATLKQLKNKSRPLPVLKMLNPKPTLIDVLSFSDFISITPINTVIFDNVTLTTEMLKHVLGSLLHNEGLEKLSLRNVPIDATGWVYLCEFMSRNTNVKKLDISQQKIKLSSKQTALRSSMNWNLLIESLMVRKGLEELVMGGCKLSDDIFQRLLNDALALGTYRLGVAGTELNTRKCEIITDWISRPDSACVGIDVAFNDLSKGQLRPFIDTFLSKDVKLIFFSLNSTNLTNVDEVAELLWALVRVKTLRFLDLSSVPELFPGVILKLAKTLPLFESLRRIHFDLNELTTQSIDAIADILPKVPRLVHVSLLGNRNLDRGSVGSLYTAIKSSDIFTLDLDYDLVPPEFSQRLALYLMKNLDKFIRPDINDIGVDSEQEDVMFDGSLLMETAEKMLLESDKTPGQEDLKVQKIVTNALIDRTRTVRKEIHIIIDKLFEKRNSGELSFEGKETLLRFCLLDASLEKLLSMFEEKAKLFSGTPLSPTPTPSYENGTQIDQITVKPKQLHESSVALIDSGPILMAKNSRPCVHPPLQINEAFEPHSVVIDASSDGKNVPVDYFTGKPVLMKSASQTSVYAKQQELEEGEFHRWGVFVQHRQGDDKVPETLAHEGGKADLPLLGAVPSGSELREAIIDAKGIESVTQLISKINNNRVSIENIYRTKPGVSNEETIKSSSTLPNSELVEELSERAERIEDEVCSIDSEHDVHPVVNEAYDMLLNEADRVRSNK